MANDNNSNVSKGVKYLQRKYPVDSWIKIQGLIQSQEVIGHGERDFCGLTMPVVITGGKKVRNIDPTMIKKVWTYMVKNHEQRN